MTEQTRRAETVRSVLLSAAALLLFDAGFNLARGSALPPRYWLAIAAASLALAALVGALAAAVGGGTRLALALWLGVEGFAWREAPLGRMLLLGAAVGLLTWFLLGLRPGRRRGAAAAGLSVACSFALATLVWPRLGASLGVVAGRGLAGELWAVGVFAFLLLLLSTWPWLGLARRPRPGWLAAGLMLTALVATHLAYRQARPQTGDPGAAAGGGAATAGDRPSIILLILDTVRADALTIYGSPWDTTPRLARFVEASERAMVYPWAFAPSNWTLPSHASLFTGLPPSEHGAHEGAGGLAGSPFSAARLRAERTLAEVLAARGYRTALLTANPTLLRVRGMERGFGLLRQPPPPRPSSLMAERLRRALAPSLLAGDVGETPKAWRVAAELVEFLERGPGPAFVVANFMEAHTPYVPPLSEAGLFSGGRLLRGPDEARPADPAPQIELARLRYLEEIRALDRQLGVLLGELAAGGHLDASWLVVTSDHGEAFMEHGSTNHGGGIYNEQVRVPLVIQPPRGVELRPEAPVSLLDLATTLAAVGGVGEFGSGRDLAAATVAPAPVAVEFFGSRLEIRTRYSPHAEEPAAAVVIERLKLLRRGEHEELYDLAADPAERRDRLAERWAEAERLRAALPALRLDPSLDEGPARELAYEERETLRALGYLD